MIIFQMKKEVLNNFDFSTKDFIKQKLEINSNDIDLQAVKIESEKVSEKVNW